MGGTRQLGTGVEGKEGLSLKKQSLQRHKCDLITRQEKHLRSLETWRCLSLRSRKQHEEEVKSNRSPGGSRGLNMCLATNSIKLGRRPGSDSGPLFH